jgi:hypothetical protein
VKKEKSKAALITDPAFFFWYETTGKTSPGYFFRHSYLVVGRALQQLG